MNGEAGPEETGGAIGVPKPVPIDQWPMGWQMAFWDFHQQRRTGCMDYAYLQLGSDAGAEEAVDLTIDQVMDRWPRMLQMENLDGYAWTISQAPHHRHAPQAPAPPGTGGHRSLRGRTLRPA